MSETWTVTIQQGHSCVFEIEAENRDDAIDRAKRLWDRGDYYSGRYEPLGTRITDVRNLGVRA